MVLKEVARVVHLSFEAASALKIIPSTIPMSITAGSAMQLEVYVVDDQGSVVHGGQNGRTIRVSTLVNASLRME